MYDDGSGSDEMGCSITEQNEGYKAIQSNSPLLCEVTFMIPQDVPIVDDVFIYFELEGFYQNHRRYVLSRSNSQLKNEITFSTDLDEIADQLQLDCNPESSLFSDHDEERLIYYPCGLIAQSYFNDGIQLKSFVREESDFNLLNESDLKLEWVNGIINKPTSSGSSLAEMNIDSSGIAWLSDLDNTFRNPTRSNHYARYDSYEYIWQTYDQFSCYDAEEPSVRQECISWQDYVQAAQPDISADFVVPGKV